MRISLAIAALSSFAMARPDLSVSANAGLPAFEFDDVGLIEFVSPPDTVRTPGMLDVAVSAKNYSLSIQQRALQFLVIVDSTVVYATVFGFDFMPEEQCTLHVFGHWINDSTVLTFRCILTPPDTNPHNDSLEKTVCYFPSDPPVFGTVVRQWDLGMSGPHAGAGITWSRDAERFYLMDQGFSGLPRVWSLDPADPVGTATEVPWIFLDLGTPAQDIPFAICSDDEAGCFWMGQVPDGDVYAGYYLLRFVWDGDSWTWGGTPGDSWCVSQGAGGLQWGGAVEHWPKRGEFATLVSHDRSPDSCGLLLFDPYGKVLLDIIGDSTIEGRGLTLVPFDSNYILTCGWRDNTFREYDSLGSLLQSVSSSAEGGCDWALHIPQNPGAEDTVCAFCICNDADNTLLRVSVGMTWGQLPGRTGITEAPVLGTCARRPSAVVVRGVLRVPGAAGAELVDVLGRRVMRLLPGENDVRALGSGIYFVRRAGERETRKVVVGR